MKIHDQKKPASALRGRLKTAGGLLLSCSLLMVSAVAADAAPTISGDSTTILRVRETGTDRLLIPLYEYLHLSGAQSLTNGTLSFHLGGWARGDLADDTTRQNTNGDLQYGFMSYQGNKSNASFSIGRQFVTEGVAAEKLDGLYMRSDFVAGFTGAAYVGLPAATEPNYKGGNLMYGGRLAHSSKWYSLGLSYLKNNEGGSSLREEEGVDLWLHPLPMMDISGRSSYNSLTSGWMENYYTLSVNPMDMLRFSFSLDQVEYRHYFHHVTTSALALNNGPFLTSGVLAADEAFLSLGGSIGITPVKNLGISLDYKNYNYDLAGSADFFGGGVTYQFPENLSAGLTYHRMIGGGPGSYNQYHAYAFKKVGRADFTLDFFDVDFDDGNSINRVSNTWSLAGVIGYDFPQNVRVAGDVSYSKTIDTSDDFRGLIKVVYAFGSQGRAK